MALVDRPFGETFAFARPSAAPRRDASGAIVTVAANQPRWDHDAAGNRLGLLIEPGAALGQQDDLALAHDNWVEPGPATMLAAWRDPAGVIHYRASYTQSPAGAVAAMLATCGHLMQIGVVSGYLANRAKPGQPGFVRFRGISWRLASVLTVGDGLLLDDGTGRPLIEGS